MKIKILVLSIFVFGCQNKQEKKVTMSEETSFYVGTYTSKDSKGIYKYSISSEGKLQKIGLVAETENPSFLAKTSNNKTLLAVDETNIDGTGFVKSYAILKDTLIELNTEKTGGAHPCFVAVNKSNDVLVANYSGGNVGLLRVNAKGKLSNLLTVQQHEGKGTTERQEAPHAHSAWFHPTKNEVISVDLGTNELWFSKIDSVKNQFVFTTQKTLKMIDGAGPRHLEFHPNNQWMYVLNELNNTVSLIKEKDGIYNIDSSISTLPKEFSAYSNAADIHISKDGKFLYASNRGHNSIVIYQVNADNGQLKLVDFQSVLGKNPRNFALSPNQNFLLVANQDTHSIIAFKRDFVSGKLKVTDQISAPTPVCILF